MNSEFHTKIFIKLLLIILLISAPIFFVSVFNSSAASSNNFNCGTNPVPGISYLGSVPYPVKYTSQVDGSYVWSAGFGSDKIECTTESTFDTTPVSDSPSAPSPKIAISLTTKSPASDSSLITTSAKIKDSAMYNKLKGQILLAVENYGKAFYVHPGKKELYSLGTPEATFDVMRNQSRGATFADISKIPLADLSYLKGADDDNDKLINSLEQALGTAVDKSDTDGDGYNDYNELRDSYNPLGSGKLKYNLTSARANAGKILLQVSGCTGTAQCLGQAWYVDTSDNPKRYFFNTPTDAWQLLPQLGLGISNTNLSKLASVAITATTIVTPELQVQIDSSQANPMITKTNGQIMPKYDDNLATIQASAEVIGKLKNLRDKGLSFQADASGRLKHLAGPSGKPIPLTQKVTGQENIALQFLKDYGSYFQLIDSATQVVKDRIKIDNSGYSHLRYQSVYKGIPIWGSSFLIHLNKANQVTSATGNFLSGISLVTTPTLNIAQSKTQAEAIGKAQFKMTTPEAGEANLVIYNPKILDAKVVSKNYLAYEVAIDDKNNLALGQELIIDAKTGSLLLSSPTVMFSLDRRIYNCHGTEDDCLGNEDLEDDNSGRFEGDDSVDDSDVNKIYDDVYYPYAYLETKFGIDGANGLGGITDHFRDQEIATQTPMFANSNITETYGGGVDSFKRAFYSSSRGIVFAPINRPDQDSAMTLFHEYAHGVVVGQGPRSAVYTGETAAITEGYAEVFANYIGYFVYNFYFKDDVFASEVTHYSNFNCNNRDYTIQRYHNMTAVTNLDYLLSMGGSLMGCEIEDVGTDVMENLFFSSLNFLPDNFDFQGLHEAINDACEATYDNTICDRVKFAIQVAEFDHPGVCDDPEGLEDDGPHCFSSNKTRTDAYLRKLNQATYECGYASVFDDWSKKYKSIDFGVCQLGGNCINNKCVKCIPETDKELCRQYDYQCGVELLAHDKCGVMKRINCEVALGGCTKQFGEGYVCSQYKCIKNETAQWYKGPYDSSGQNRNNGGYYRQVKIGAQTWFRDNLLYGTPQQDLTKQQKDDSKIEAYLADDNSGNSSGFYQWAEAMALPYECNLKDCSDKISAQHQGICPEGYHIPNEADWQYLEQHYTNADEVCDSNRLNQWGCWGVGTMLQQDDMTSFSAKLPGYIEPWQGHGDVLTLFGVNNSAGFVSATQNSATHVYFRKVSSRWDGVWRGTTNKRSLYNVRCLANCQPVDGQWSDWKPMGGCGEFKAGMQTEYRECLNQYCSGAICQGDSRRETTCDAMESCGGLIKYEGGNRNVYGKKDYVSGGYYGTVKICDSAGKCQCWMQDNLNVGVILPAGNGFPTDSVFKASSNNKVIEKYCYWNDEMKCKVYGALYQGQEVMNWTDPKDNPVKGICPSGWHVPTRTDFNTLNTNINNNGRALLKTKECLLGEKDCASTNFDIITDKIPNPPTAYKSWDNYFHVWTSVAGDKAGNFAVFGLQGDANNSYAKTPVLWAWWEKQNPAGLRCIKGCLPVDGYWQISDAETKCGQTKQFEIKKRYTPIAPECKGKPVIPEADMIRQPDGSYLRYEQCERPNCGEFDHLGLHQETTLVYGKNEFGHSIYQCWMRSSVGGTGVTILPIYDENGKRVYQKYQGEADKNAEVVEGYYYDYYRKDKWTKIIQDYSFKWKYPLFTWREAMNLPDRCEAEDCSNLIQNIHQGLCPNGWHVPSDAEWHELELHLTTNPADCQSSRLGGWGCPGAGRNIANNVFSICSQTSTVIGGSLYTFDTSKTKLGNYTAEHCPYRLTGFSITTWSSTQQSAQHAIVRRIDTTDAVEKNSWMVKSTALPLQCLKNKACVSIDYLSKYYKDIATAVVYPNIITTGGGVGINIGTNCDCATTNVNLTLSPNAYAIDIPPSALTILVVKNQIDILNRMREVWAKIPSGYDVYADPLNLIPDDLEMWPVCPACLNIKPIIFRPQTDSQNNVVSYYLDYFLTDDICEVQSGNYTATPTSLGRDSKGNEIVL